MSFKQITIIYENMNYFMCLTCVEQCLTLKLSNILGNLMLLKYLFMYSKGKKGNKTKY